MGALLDSSRAAEVAEYNRKLEEGLYRYAQGELNSKLGITRPAHADTWTFYSLPSGDALLRLTMIDRKGQTYSSRIDVMKEWTPDSAPNSMLTELVARLIATVPVSYLPGQVWP